MKKYSTVLAILFVISLVVVAYAGHEHMVIPYEKQGFGLVTKMPIPSGGDLRQHIIGQEPYKKWEMWPGKGKMFKGTEPHGSLLTVYVNDRAVNSIKKMKGMTNNSIIVKENYAPNRDLVAITVMYKVKGYNPEAGDWFWAKYSADWEVLAEGKVKGCLACHGAAKSNDYVFTGKVTK